MSNDKLNEILGTLLEAQRPMDSEAQRLLDANLWELIGAKPSEILVSDTVQVDCTKLKELDDE